jgi:hypothetical protein
MSATPASCSNEPTPIAALRKLFLALTVRVWPRAHANRARSAYEPQERVEH